MYGFARVDRERILAGDPADPIGRCTAMRGGARTSQLPEALTLWDRKGSPVGTDLNQI